MRVGHGEVYEPGESSETAWVARGLFLACLSTLAPEVLRDLKETALPVYRELPQEARLEPTLVNWTVAHGWSALAELAGDTSLRAASSLIDLLSTWAHKHQIEADWAYDCALSRLHAWDVGDKSETWRIPRQVGGFEISWEELAFSFTQPGWSPQLHTRSDYENRLRAAFERHLKKYLDGIETAAGERGLVRTPELRRRGTRSSARRFEWLVRWQVQSWNLGRIADEARVAKNTVRDGIRAAASEIGLILRKGTLGRPRKRET
jgi:hypothetical protein